MQTAIALLILLMPTLVLAQVVPVHTWQVETVQRPAPYALELIRGESITLAPQYLSNGAAIALPGSATAALRYRSADMAAETYYSLAGTVTGSTARFAWESTNCAPATNYTYAIAVTGSGVNLRSYGTLKLVGVVSGTQTSAPTLYAPYPWETTVPLLSNSFLGNGSATINGAALTNGSSITVVAALPAGAITATNQGLPGQSFFFSTGTPTGTYTGYFATAAGSGDMLASVYDPAGVQRGVVFANDQRYLAALTNAAAFATAAQGTKADTALQPADTNGWVVSSHSGFATNSGGAGAGYYAMSNGAWTVFSPGSGSANALTNGGATLLAGTDISLSSTSLTNGASITISYTGGGSTGGISGATASNIVAGIMATGHVATATTVTGAQSNLIAAALQPASTQGLATVAYVDAATNAAVVDATNRVAGVGYLLPASTQNLVTATQLSTATNAAIIEATNRVAGVGYLLPASTQGLATVAQVTAATNGIDASFLASKGALTNNGATINGSPITNGAAITISGTGGADEVSTNYFRNAPNLTNLTAAGIVTNYQCNPQTILNLTNTSPLTITAQVNRVYSLTAIGSSNITVALEGTNCIGESWLNLNVTQTNGGTTWFWPSGLYHWNRGTGSSNAPGVSNYGRVEIYHNAQQFVAFHMWTNTPFGAP